MRARFGDRSRQAVLDGAGVMEALIEKTYGPSGRVVLIDRKAGMVGTRDGATVAREAGARDWLEDLSISAIRDACLEVERKTGDGTSTTALIAATLLREGRKRIVSGEDPVRIAESIRRCVPDLVRGIRDVAIPADEDLIWSVAYRASKSDREITDAVTKAVLESGENANIVVQNGERVGIEILHKEGMVLEAYPATEVPEGVVEGTLVAVFGKALETVEDVQGLLEEATQWPRNPLLILCPHITGMAAKTVAMNNHDRKRQDSELRDQPVIVYVTKNPHADRQGDIEDIAAATSAVFFSPETGQGKFKPGGLGTARSVVCKPSEVEITLYEENYSDVESRIKVLKGNLSRCDSEYERDRLQERIAALDGGLCILKVACVGESELREKRSRIEDTLSAVSVALRCGVVPGAGNVLLYLSSDIEDPTLKKALRKPAELIRESNSPQRVGDPWIGWDYDIGKDRDLRVHPAIVDPCEVVVEALKAAVSVATTLLTVEVSISRKR